MGLGAIAGRIGLGAIAGRIGLGAIMGRIGRGAIAGSPGVGRSSATEDGLMESAGGGKINSGLTVGRSGNVGGSF
jgi:hypothetical protein